MSNRHHEFIIKKKHAASPALRAGARSHNAQKFAVKPKRPTQRDIVNELSKRASDNFWNAMFARFGY